jgi:hypothetical protein
MQPESLSINYVSNLDALLSIHQKKKVKKKGAAECPKK